MVKNKMGGESNFGNDPQLVERGTPEYFARRPEEHIKYFIPPGWKEQIRVVMSYPFLTAEDWLVYKKGFDEGTLDQAMESYPMSKGPHRWMIRAAIKDFFNQGKQNEK